jgi:prephenate dehydrogenase
MATVNKIENVAIIGLGLLGASLGMALRGRAYHRLGWTRRSEVRNWALENDVIDETCEDIKDLLAKADLTILCLPIPKIMEFIETHADCWKAGAVVSDIGSVKEVIVNCGEKLLAPRGVNFVGSHPMAGTEKSGPDAAFESLYVNAEVFVTKTENTSLEALNCVKELWKSIGTKIVELGVCEHDSLVAHTSHISHIMALALTEAVLDCDQETLALRYSGCATGFRDTSRITSSSPSMWREIIENNQSAVLEVVKELGKRYRNLSEIIENKDYDKLEAEFCKGKKLRDDWMEYKNNG